ncbi:MAG TPA: hypothetical protein VED84_07210 [Acidimicrobiales bacterium]|nr:hypothetical protein [Acidimicrobiales bacterium]
MTVSPGESRHWVVANASAHLGLPIAPEERHRLLKRVVVGLCRPFLRPQIEYNLALLAELVTIRDQLVEQTKSLGARTTERFAALIEQLDAQGSQIRELYRLVDGLNSRVDDVSIDRDLVHQEVELAQIQALERIDAALARIRSESGALRRETGERPAGLDRGRGRARGS